LGADDLGYGFIFECVEQTRFLLEINFEFGLNVMNDRLPIWIKVYAGTPNKYPFKATPIEFKHQLLQTYALSTPTIA
jgi:hypothetical protein